MNNIKHFFGGFIDGFRKFGHGIGAIINSVLLLAVYLLGVGVTSIIAKLKRKHFLGEGSSQNAESYWSDLNLKKKPIDNYYRQF